jgi:hypothetical protein
VTKAHVILPEVIEALQSGRLKADGKVLTAGGAATVTKAAVEPVWYLPGVAQRFKAARAICAACCSKKPAACTPSWSRAATWRCFCRPSAGLTLYIFGNPRDLANPEWS